MALDLAAATAALKEYYNGQRLKELTYKDAPLYAMIAKKMMGGKNMPLPMRVTPAQNGSADFSVAVAEDTSSLYRSFLLTHNKDYSLATIANDAILGSNTDTMAFLKLARAEIDGAIEMCRRSVQIDLYGNGSGARAQIASVSGTVVTLADPESVVKFEVGQALVVYTAQTGGSAHIWATSVPSAQITAIDRDNSTLTIGAISTGVTATTGDYLFRTGDRGLKYKGLAGWFPATAPAPGDNWFGVDRSVDTERLAGVRITGTNKPLDEAWIDFARRMGRAGQAPDVGFCSWNKYAELEKTLSSKVRYAGVDVAGIAFRGIEMSGPNGKSFKIFPDKDCNDTTAYLLKLDTLGYYSLQNDPIKIIDSDGQTLLRVATQDAFQARVGFYGQLGCDMPVANGVMSF